MAKRDKLILSAHQFIETSRDINGRYFVAYSGGASLFIREVKDLRRFLKIATGIPMRESLESWLASLADMDHGSGTCQQQGASFNKRGSCSANIAEPFTRAAGHRVWP